jgi:hypothetical protein
MSKIFSASSPTQSQCNSEVYCTIRPFLRFSGRRHLHLSLHLITIYALAMFSPVSAKSDNHQILTNPHDATDSLKIPTKEVDDVRQLDERTNLIRVGTNTEGIVDEWNYNANMVTGFDGSTIGQSLLNFVREPIRVSFQEVLDKALGGEGTSKYVLECTSNEETVLYLLVNVEPRFSDKTIVGTTISGQDMTESIKKDREMYAMARELRQLVDTANAVSHLMYDICVIYVSYTIC